MAYCPWSGSARGFSDPPPEPAEPAVLWSKHGTHEGFWTMASHQSLLMDWWHGMRWQITSPDIMIILDHFRSFRSSISDLNHRCFPISEESTEHRVNLRPGRRCFRRDRSAGVSPSLRGQRRPARNHRDDPWQSQENGCTWWFHKQNWKYKLKNNDV